MGKISRLTLWLLVFACASPLIALDSPSADQAVYHTVWTARDGLTGFASLSIADSILEGQIEVSRRSGARAPDSGIARDTAFLFLIDGFSAAQTRATGESLRVNPSASWIRAIGVLSTHDLT